MSHCLLLLRISHKISLRSFQPFIRHDRKRIRRSSFPSAHFSRELTKNLHSPVSSDLKEPILKAANMGGLRASMDDFADGLDCYGSDAGSLVELDAVNDNIFDEEFDPSVLLKEPLFDDAPLHHDRMFNKSSMAEEDFGTFVEVAPVPQAVPTTPTDSGTSSPYMTTPRNYLMDEQMGRLGNEMRGMAVAPQGLPLLDHQSYQPMPHHRRQSPTPMGYGGTVPIGSPYGNSPPSPPMMSSARRTGLEMNTSPSMMPPDMISVHSMPNSVQSDLRSVSSFEGPTRSQSASSPVAPGQEIKSFNEAMEKLCESMKRSAMSRNLVKQLSGRNIVKQSSARALSLTTKQGSMRSLPRQGSGRFQLAKELSNHSLHTQLSSRSLHKQLSGRNLAENSGRVTPTGTVPVRRMSIDMKHRICTSPGRGIYRQRSSGSLNGKRAMLQIDDSAMGIFYPEDTMNT
jgi:hypothetical protein